MEELRGRMSHYLSSSTAQCPPREPALIFSRPIETSVMVTVSAQCKQRMIIARRLFAFLLSENTSGSLQSTTGSKTLLSSVAIFRFWRHAHSAKGDLRVYSSVRVADQPAFCVQRVFGSSHPRPQLGDVILASVLSKNPLSWRFAAAKSSSPLVFNKPLWLSQSDTYSQSAIVIMLLSRLSLSNSARTSQPPNKILEEHALFG